MSDPVSLFIAEDDALIATELSRGPWDPSSCHGGPVAALLVRTCEQTADGDSSDNQRNWQLARITVELVRPVPVLQPLLITSDVERPGRNVSLIGARITLEDGTEVARARALRMRVADVTLSADYVLEPPFSEVASGTKRAPSFVGEHTSFHRDAVDMRFFEGSWIERGPVKVWCRLLYPVVAGELPTGPQRAVAAADFSNGVSSELDPTEAIFINPDLSVHLLRTPIGEWIGMHARSFYGPHGAGIAEAALYDGLGRCGRSTQSLFVNSR